MNTLNIYTVFQCNVYNRKKETVFACRPLHSHNLIQTTATTNTYPITTDQHINNKYSQISSLLLSQWDVTTGPPAFRLVLSQPFPFTLLKH